MRSLRPLVVAVLAVLLAASSPQHVLAGTWLYYDDGTPVVDFWIPAQENQLAVRFSLPSGRSGAKLLTARYYVTTYLEQFGVHVYDLSWSELTPPGILTTPPLPWSWWDVDLSAYEITVYGDFYVSIERTGFPVSLGQDPSDPTGRSYFYDGLVWSLMGSINFIRAEVEFEPITYELCVVQLGVGEPNGAVSWWPGYGYPDLPISQCQDKTEYYTDVLGRTIVIHQFNQTRINPVVEPVILIL